MQMNQNISTFEMKSRKCRKMRSYGPSGVPSAPRLVTNLGEAAFPPGTKPPNRCLTGPNTHRSQQPSRQLGRHLLFPLHAIPVPKGENE